MHFTFYAYYAPSVGQAVWATEYQKVPQTSQSPPLSCWSSALIWRWAWRLCNSSRANWALVWWEWVGRGPSEAEPEWDDQRVVLPAPGWSARVCRALFFCFLMERTMVRWGREWISSLFIGVRTVWPEPLQGHYESGLCRPEQRFWWAAEVRTWGFAERRNESGQRD